jgi:hypothetical protein
MEKSPQYSDKFKRYVCCDAFYMCMYFLKVYLIRDICSMHRKYHEGYILNELGDRDREKK